MIYDPIFNPSPDIAAMRERSHERDLAVHGLHGAVIAIVSGAKFSGISNEFRLQQLADALANCEARQAAAEARYEADMAAWRAKLAADALADPENDLAGI
jgi:hypothetical protein